MNHPHSTSSTSSHTGQTSSYSSRQTIYTALLIALAAAFYYWGLTENVEPLIIKGLAVALFLMALLPYAVGNMADQSGGRGK
jgi:hypothetical protein